MKLLRLIIIAAAIIIIIIIITILHIVHQSLLTKEVSHNLDKTAN